MFSTGKTSAYLFQVGESPRLRIAKQRLSRQRRGKAKLLRLGLGSLQPQVLN